MRWIGLDGQEKGATFIRADALDVVVLATASQTASGDYLYSYEVRNLPTGANYLNRFLVQTSAPEVRFRHGEDSLGGSVTKQIKDYSEGQWYSFADVSDHVQANPGQTVTISLTSNATPVWSSAAPAPRPWSGARTRRCLQTSQTSSPATTNTCAARPSAPTKA